MTHNATAKYSQFFKFYGKIKQATIIIIIITNIILHL